MCPLAGGHTAVRALAAGEEEREAFFFHRFPHIWQTPRSSLQLANVMNFFTASITCIKLLKLYVSWSLFFHLDYFSIPCGIQSPVPLFILLSISLPGWGLGTYIHFVTLIGIIHSSTSIHLQIFLRTTNWEIGK